MAAIRQLNYGRVLQEGLTQYSRELRSGAPQFRPATAAIAPPSWISPNRKLVIPWMRSTQLAFLTTYKNELPTLCSVASTDTRTAIRSDSGTLRVPADISNSTSFARPPQMTSRSSTNTSVAETLSRLPAFSNAAGRRLRSKL